MNPGLHPRNPKKHSKEYLQMICASEKTSRICAKCELIIGRGAKKAKHCEYCDVCIIGYDHHCVWSSKCIGRGNIFQFNAFLFLTVICVVGFWVNLLTLIFADMKINV